MSLIGQAIFRRSLFTSDSDEIAQAVASSPNSESQSITYNLPENAFIEELRRLNGTPEEVLEHPELMQLMLPILRADFQMRETYHYLPGAPLNGPITAFGGLQDEKIPREYLEAWRDHTSARFNL